MEKLIQNQNVEQYLRWPLGPLSSQESDRGPELKAKTNTSCSATWDFFYI